MRVDPARDAASVLRRIGFLVLMVGLPVAALATRSAPVFVAAIGVALLVSAATFAGSARPARDAAARIALAPASAAVLLLFGWALLSLAWTPAPRPAAAAALAVFGIGALGVAGYLALPERMRSANLYPAPIGAAMGAIAALLYRATVAADDPEDIQRLGRCLAILVVFVWPAVAWLRSRERDIEAVALAVGTAVAAGFGPSVWSVVALAVGALAYLVGQVFWRGGAVGVGSALAALVLAAPLVALGAGSSAGLLSSWAAGIEPWRSAILAEPMRWLTGHGIGALAARPLGQTLPAAFGSPLLGLWYDLGLVGAAALALAIPAALVYAARSFGPLLPALAAAFATTFVVALAGPERGAWWPTALVAVAIVFVATERGQFRTRRPRALRLARTRTA